MKRKNIFNISVFSLITFFSFNMNGQIISQYIDTDGGTSPKGIEIWNNTASTLDFSINNLVVEKGTNGNAPSADATITAGTLTPNAVIVIGTSGIGSYLINEGLAVVTYLSEPFTFNGDDALVVKYGGIITDVFGVAEVDPGSSWDGNGVSTKDQNIRLIDETDTAGGGLNTGNTEGWSDPSTRFVTVNTTPSSLPEGLAGFGIAPITTVWNGSESSNWSTIANWSNGIPIVSSNVSIADVDIAPVIGATIGALSNDLRITESEGINITAGGSLIVSGVSTGSVTYNRALSFISGKVEGWYLVASPVAGQSYNNAYASANGLATSGSKRALATYDDAAVSGSKWSYLEEDDSNAGVFISGASYSLKRGSTAGTVSFNGTINTDNVATRVVADGNGFNLLGNPYTSYINSATFLTDNSASLVSETIWLWNQGTANYETQVTGSDFILAPGQGFFVRVHNTTNLNFVKSNQITSVDTFQKVSTPEINLLITDGTNDRFAKIHYLENATTGFDNGYDGESFGGIPNSIDVFTQLLSDNEGAKYQIQALPNFGYENMLIPVGINAAAGAEITFTTVTLNLPATIKVFLEDRLTNTFRRLDEANSAYKVTLTETINGIGRFYIHTTSNVLSREDAVLNSIRVFKTDASALRIIGLPKGSTSLYLYNIVGEEIITTVFISNGNKEISLSNLASGVYLAKIQTDKGATNKIIILK